MNRTLRNLLLDATAGVGYLIALYPRWTGLQWHEWLGLAVFGALVTHVLLHLRWVIALTRRILANLRARAKLNYVLDAGLLIGFLMLIVSGLVISSVFEMPYRLGLSIVSYVTWVRVHSLSSDVTIALVVLHLVLHWRWIVRATSRYLLGRRDTAPASGVAAEVGGD